MAENLARLEDTIHSFKIWMENHTEGSHLGDLRAGGEDSRPLIPRIDLTVCEGMNWIELARDIIQWSDSVTAVIKIRVREQRIFSAISITIICSI
jgi:hypothetical protein